MAKVCVFCGKKPNEKTKEHVVPRWLIELTGDPKREAFLGFIKNIETGFTERKYSFDQFTFPACDGCNSKYARLESIVKPVIIKLLNNDKLLAEELSILLDWLDKVRVGLWLGMNQLDKNYANVDPNFHIETRISQYDRMLIVEKSDCITSKLNFGGIDTFSFALTPSAFVLIINNMYLTNISYMFLFARRLGFPYPSAKYIHPNDERVAVDFANGIERVMLPLLRKTINEKGTIIYQPMFKGGLIDGDVSEYYTEYSREHSMDFENGIGNIFQDNDGKLLEYSNGDLLNILPNYIHDDHDQFINSAINIYEWQNWLVQFMPSDERLDKEQKQFIKSRFRTGVRINNILIKHHKSLLKK